SLRRKASRSGGWQGCRRKAAFGHNDGMPIMTKSSNALAVRRRGGADPTLPAILEFQWPSTAIVNAPIPRSARGTVWVITSLVIVMIATMGLIPVDQVVSVHGVAISKAATILVQPLETAIVRSIEVREGQQVRAGEVLA